MPMNVEPLGALRTRIEDLYIHHTCTCIPLLTYMYTPSVYMYMYVCLSCIAVLHNHHNVSEGLVHVC